MLAKVKDWVKSNKVITIVIGGLAVVLAFLLIFNATRPEVEREIAKDVKQIEEVKEQREEKVEEIISGTKLSDYSIATKEEIKEAVESEFGEGEIDYDDVSVKEYIEETFGDDTYTLFVYNLLPDSTLTETQNYSLLVQALDALGDETYYKGEVKHNFYSMPESLIVLNKEVGLVENTEGTEKTFNPKGYDETVVVNEGYIAYMNQENEKLIGETYSVGATSIVGYGEEEGRTKITMYTSPTKEIIFKDYIEELSKMVIEYEDHTYEVSGENIIAELKLDYTSFTDFEGLEKIITPAHYVEVIVTVGENISNEEFKELKINGDKLLIGRAKAPTENKF